MNKMKERKKRKEQLSDRKSLAAQNRMKSIAGLAADESKGVGSGGGGSVGGANKRRKKGGEDDGFGKSDADWAVYREIVSLDSLWLGIDLDADPREEVNRVLEMIQKMKKTRFNPSKTSNLVSYTTTLRSHSIKLPNDSKCEDTNSSTLSFMD